MAWRWGKVAEFAFAMNVLLTLGYVAVMLGVAYLAYRLGRLAQGWAKHLEWKRWVGRR